MKYTYPLFIVLLSAASLSAQSKFPVDSASHTVVYKQTYKLGTKVKIEDVYAAAQTWFEAPAKFTQKNADPPIDTVKAKKNKKKADVDHEFDNSHPLQMLDPEGGKLVGMGLLKYYGGTTTTSIKLLYIKYDIYVVIKGSAATVSILNVRYFHLDAKSYAQASIYNYAGGKPCEETGKIEELISCENFHEEFKNLALYFNKETGNLCADFKNMLKTKKLLYDPKAASPAPASKPTTKPTTKPVAKPAPQKK